MAATSYANHSHARGRPELTETPTKLVRRGFEGDRLDELVIEAVDEQTLHEVRKRKIARMRLLWANRRFLIQTAIWGLVVGVLAAFLIPKRYESVARLMPPDQGSSAAGAALAALTNTHVGGGLASLAQGALGIKTTGDLFMGILKSDAVENDLIRKFNLQKIYKDRYMEDARKDLAKHTDVTEDQKSGIITVSVTDHSSERAAAMAREYVDELNWVVNQLDTSSAHRERVFLDQRLQQVKGDLELSEKQFSQFASQKGAIDVPTQGRAMLGTAATVQGELIAAEAELQALRQIYTDDNTRVRSVQARIDELRDALQGVAGRNAKDTSTTQDIYPSLSELPLLGVTYADLLRRTKLEEVVFETLTQQEELAKVDEAKEIPSVKLLDPPEAPEKSSFPPRAWIMALTTAGALILSIVWILGNSAWKAVNSADPGKSLAIEIWSDLRANRLLGSGNWSHNGRESESTRHVRDRLVEEEKQTPRM